MKKLFYSLLLAAVTISSQAQTRYSDFSCTLRSPKSGDLIRDKTAFNVNFTLRNEGSDDSKAGDTLIVALVLDGNPIPGTVSIFTLANVMKMGDSLPFSLPNLMMQGGTGNASAQFCALGLVRYRSSNETLVDSNTANNLGCATVDYMSNVGIGDIPVVSGIEATTYPNPANDVTSFRYMLSASDFVTINLFDIQGKLVRSVVNETQSPGGYIISVPTDKLKAGIYIYSMSVSDRTSSGRLVVIH